MTSFMIAYLIVWLAAVAYLAWLGLRQRALAQEIAALERRLASPDAEDWAGDGEAEKPASRAA